MGGIGWQPESIHHDQGPQERHHGESDHDQRQARAQPRFGEDAETGSDLAIAKAIVQQPKCGENRQRAAQHRPRRPDGIIPTAVEPSAARTAAPHISNITIGASQSAIWATVGDSLPPKRRSRAIRVGMRPAPAGCRQERRRRSRHGSREAPAAHFDGAEHGAPRLGPQHEGHQMRPTAAASTHGGPR